MGLTKFLNPMHYAISYVSTADTDLETQEIKDLLAHSKKINNERNITGLLLFSEGNFFQVIEGNKMKVKNLFQKIKDDKRHHGIIKIFEKEITRESYNGYESSFLSEEAKYNDPSLQYYINYLKVLDPKSQNTIKSILRAFIS